MPRLERLWIRYQLEAQKALEAKTVASGDVREMACLITVLQAEQPPIINPTLCDPKDIVAITIPHEYRTKELEGARLQGFSFLSSLHFCKSGLEVLIFQKPNSSIKDTDTEVKNGGMFWI